MNGFDIVIRGGKIVDGSGNGWFRSDVGIKQGRIAEIGNLSTRECLQSIHASGLVVCPGFIDIHSHSDFSLMTNPRAESHLRQGVTTVVTGNCGISAFPVEPDGVRLWMEYNKSLCAGAELTWKDLDGYFARLEEKGLSVNVAPMIGHGNLRAAVMGMDSRGPSNQEMADMKDLLAAHLDRGAFGLTTVLIKPPGCYSTTEELVELCRVVAAHSGLYVTHLRSESDELENAVQEAIEIGRRASLPIHVSHHKAAGRDNWGKTVRTLAMMDEARDSGVDITCDVYPYLAGSLPLVSLLPSWTHEGGLQMLLDRISQREVRRRLCAEAEDGDTIWSLMYRGEAWAKVTIISVGSPRNHWAVGLAIPQVAEKKGTDLFEALFDLLVEENGVARVVIEMLCEQDVERVLKYRFSAIGSDGWCEDSDQASGKGLVHPRLYGTFPRLLGVYVRERSVLRLEDAVRKMTSLARPEAWTMGSRPSSARPGCGRRGVRCKYRCGYGHVLRAEKFPCRNQICNCERESGDRRWGTHGDFRGAPPEEGGRSITITSHGFIHAFPSMLLFPISY